MRSFNYSAIRNQKWDSEILGLIAAIYKEAGKQELYLQQQPEDLEKLIDVAKIQSTEASNAIEGIVTTNTRIRQLVEEKTTPKNRNEQEIAGYRDALNIIHESFDAIPITQNYILQLHRILYGHMNNPLAGRTKTVQNYISATYPDGHVETLFTPLAPYETPEALDRICEEYNRVIGNMELEPLIAIPVFIHDFLCIHPFNDGNGRMSRLLTTLLLYRNGFYVGKYISLEAKIAKNKDLYYDALAHQLAPQQGENGKFALSFILPTAVFREQWPDHTLRQLFLNTDDSHIESMQAFLDEYMASTNPGLPVTSRQTMAEQYQTQTRSSAVMGNAVSVVIALVGVLNFINSMVTAIVSRRREFAVMQSVGMTKKQLCRMLVNEGLYYAGAACYPLG